MELSPQLQRVKVRDGTDVVRLQATEGCFVFANFVAQLSRVRLKVGAAGSSLCVPKSWLISRLPLTVAVWAVEPVLRRCFVYSTRRVGSGKAVTETYSGRHPDPA